MNAVEAGVRPGADLWIVTDLAVSRWAQQIDWRLNFQLSRAALRSAPPISESMQALLRKWKLPQLQFEKDEAGPLLVASQAVLPNRCVMLVPGLRAAKDWVRVLSKTVPSLRLRNVRCFLPADLAADDVQKQWGQQGGNKQEFQVEFFADLPVETP